MAATRSRPSSGRDDFDGVVEVLEQALAEAERITQLRDDELARLRAELDQARREVRSLDQVRCELIEERNQLRQVSPDAQLLDDVKRILQLMPGGWSKVPHQEQLTYGEAARATARLNQCDGYGWETQVAPWGGFTPVNTRPL